MNRARIIATGATGKMGSMVVTELLKVRYPVRALVHREDAASHPNATRNSPKQNRNP